MQTIAAYEKIESIGIPIHESIETLSRKVYEKVSPEISENLSDLKIKTLNKLSHYRVEYTREIDFVLDGQQGPTSSILIDYHLRSYMIETASLCNDFVDVGLAMLGDIEKEKEDKVEQAKNEMSDLMKELKALKKTLGQATLQNEELNELIAQEKEKMDELKNEMEKTTQELEEWKKKFELSQEEHKNQIIMYQQWVNSAYAVNMSDLDTGLGKTEWDESALELKRCLEKNDVDLEALKDIIKEVKMKKQEKPTVFRIVNSFNIDVPKPQSLTDGLFLRLADGFSDYEEKAQEIPEKQKETDKSNEAKESDVPPHVKNFTRTLMGIFNKGEGSDDSSFERLEDHDYC
uniref:Kinetochore protein SPC25 n=1 Tax=Caenorhabditis tropicalis TaxID=1561998 RepID=A0A1I7UH30_9PELO